MSKYFSQTGLDVSNGDTSDQVDVNAFVDAVDAAFDLVVADYTDFAALAALNSTISVPGTSPLVATLVASDYQLKIVNDAAASITVVDTDTALASDSDTVLVSQKAIKAYTDTALALKLALAGGTMSGDIAMGANDITGCASVQDLIAPAAGTHAANKTYVDTQDALNLPLAGGTMSGAIAMGANKVTGVTDPTAAQDAATKAYADVGRNRVINSEMMIDQRNEGSAVTAHASYPVDRFKLSFASDGALALSATRDTGIGGYRNSLKVTATTGEADMTTATDYIMPIQYKFLGYDVADLVNGATVTVSFYWESNVPDNSEFSIALGNGAAATYNYIQNFTYTTQSAEQLVTASFVIPAHASQYISNTTTGVGLTLIIGGIGGSNVQTTAGSWQNDGSLKITDTNSYNWAQTNGNYVKCSGLQFRVGSTHVPLEEKSYADYLSECLPYYETGRWREEFPASDTNNIRSMVRFKRDKVTLPTITYIDITSNASRITEYANTVASHNITPTTGPSNETLIGFELTHNPTGNITGIGYNWYASSEI